MNNTQFVKKTKEFSKKLHSNFIKELFVFDKLDSTNSTAKELAVADAEEGTVVIAQTQHHGRGRFNRIWQSPEGGVYLSLILRPKKYIEKISLLPLIVALAVNQTIQSYGIKSTIKWPNDVHVDGKKIAGILLESEVKERDVIYVVVGIGVNVNINRKELSPDIQHRSTSMSYELGLQVDYYDFLRIFFTKFEEFYSSFIEQQFEKIIDEWKTHTDTLGKTIRIQTSTESHQGIAVDIDQSGFLLLRTESGDIKKILSGDCLYLDQLDHT